MLEIYENWDEKIDQCYWKTLICHPTTLSAKKEIHAKHFCLQKKSQPFTAISYSFCAKVSRLQQLVILGLLRQNFLRSPWNKTTQTKVA